MSETRVIDAILQDVCELDPTDYPEDDRETIRASARDLRIILERHIHADSPTRFEVIDHRSDIGRVGRVFSAWHSAITLSYQDGGRTLKVFVDDPAPRAPETEHE